MYTYNNTTHNAQQCSLLSRSTAWRVRSKTWNIALPGIAEAIKGSKPPHYHFHGIAQQSHLVISASRWRLSKVSFEEITLGWASLEQSEYQLWFVWAQFSFFVCARSPVFLRNRMNIPNWNCQYIPLYENLSGLATFSIDFFILKALLLMVMIMMVMMVMVMMK